MENAVHCLFSDRLLSRNEAILASYHFLVYYSQEKEKFVVTTGESSYLIDTAVDFYLNRCRQNSQQEKPQLKILKSLQELIYRQINDNQFSLKMKLS